MDTRLTGELNLSRGNTLSTNLDTNFLKILAIIAMTFDHVGKSLFPDVLLFQIIGRVAFPIFAYCIVVGVIHTSNFKKYLTRLVMFAIISQVPYVLSTNPSIEGFKENFMALNIFFTLFFSALFVHGMKDKNKLSLIAGLCGFCFLQLDYGFDTVLLLESIYLLRDKKRACVIVTSLVLMYPLFTGGDLNLFGLCLDKQGFAVLAIPFIFINTNMNLKVNKYFFYAFYPVHLMVLFLVKYFLNI